MKERASSSASGMFLIELLLAIMIFAVASAICLKVFVTAHQISAESHDMNRAILAAQNGAECFKATGGDLSETAGLLGEDFTGGDTLDMHFDSNWKPSADPDFGYTLEIKRLSVQNGLIEGEVTVSGVSGAAIFSIPVTVMEVAP